MSLKKVKITRTRGNIRRLPKQRATLVALGLPKIGKTVEKELTPAINGMLKKVSHMVVIEEI
jgi:large subunit ribosomal protein L30